MRTATLQPGDLLEGRYELLREWSTLGFEKFFAVKTLLPQFANDAAFRTMFVDEARIVAQIRHGNVVGVEHLGDHEGIIYLALEWVQGESWAALIQACHRASTVPTDVMLRIAAGACAGLQAAHELRSETGALLNVVHRDVSPQNVIIAEAGTTKLIDFGIAKSLGRSSEKTRAGMIKAKLEYASPEQVSFRPVDRRADLWGLGVILHYIFAGYLPFDVASDVHLIMAISDGLTRPLPPHIPRPIADLIRKALQVDPAARFQTAAEMKSAIESCIGSPTSPETVAACLQEFLSGPLGARRQQIREAIEAANRRTQTVEPARSQGRVRLPTMPPELAQRGWADAGARRSSVDEAPASVAPAAAAARLSPGGWALVAVTTLIMVLVWARVVMLALEMRRPLAAQVSTSMEVRRW